VRVIYRRNMTYQRELFSQGILISMSRKGTPLDNAVKESFHLLLKKETIYNNDIKSHEEYIKTVKSWLIFYNTQRRKKSRHFLFNVYFIGFTSISLFFCIN
jgi:transposase InsO family protein